MLTELTCVLCDLCCSTKIALTEHKKMCIIKQIIQMKEDNEVIAEKKEEKEEKEEELEEKEGKNEEEILPFSFYTSLVEQQTEIICQTKAIEKQYDSLMNQALQIEEQNKLIQLLFLNRCDSDY